MENNRKLLFFDIDKTLLTLPMDSSGQCETGFKRSPL